MFALTLRAVSGRQERNGSSRSGLPESSVQISTGATDQLGSRPAPVRAPAALPEQPAALPGASRIAVGQV